MHTVRPFARVARACALAFMTAACGTTDPAPVPKPSEPLTALPRPLTAAERAVIDGSNAFAFGLLREVSAANQNANVFVSPVSASMALGMTMNGAAGTTLDEMRSMLGFGSLPLADVNASYASLIALLRGLDPATEFRIANSIWSRDDFPFNESFFSTTRQYFDAEVSALDFADPASLETINAWVKAGTNGKIPTIVDGIPPDAVMYLINAMYFKGSWRDRFDPAQTRDDQFTTAAGAPVPVRMMHREGGVSYYADAELEAVDLPYGNSAFTMTVLLPREGRSVEELAATLTPERWNAVTRGMDGAEGDVYLPKFTLTFKQLLNDQLKALGMRAAFDVADFTPMSPRGRELFVSKVLQKTFVDVNEEGTEAAAATAVEVSVTSAPARITFRADRPFLFAIRERLSGTILFVGKLVTPPAG
jgi:serine protease inhibitor